MNYLCLPLSPKYEDSEPDTDTTEINMVRYESYDYGVLPNRAHLADVHCARCYTVTRPLLLMIPAKRTCPHGWTKEYDGEKFLIF